MINKILDVIFCSQFILINSKNFNITIRTILRNIYDIYIKSFRLIKITLITLLKLILNLFNTSKYNTDKSKQLLIMIKDKDQCEFAKNFTYYSFYTDFSHRYTAKCKVNFDLNIMLNANIYIVGIYFILK